MLTNLSKIERKEKRDQKYLSQNKTDLKQANNFKKAEGRSKCAKTGTIMENK